MRGQEPAVLEHVADDTFGADYTAIDHGEDGEQELQLLFVGRTQITASGHAQPSLPKRLA